MAVVATRLLLAGTPAWRWPDKTFHAIYGLLTMSELLHGRRSNVYK